MFACRSLSCPLLDVVHILHCIISPVSSLLLSLVIYPGGRLNGPEDTGPQDPHLLLLYNIYCKYTLTCLHGGLEATETDKPHERFT